MKRLEKQQQLQTDNLSIARQILADPNRYKDGSLMFTWAIEVVANEIKRLRQSQDATEK